MINLPRDLDLPEDSVLDAVAFPIGWSLDFEALTLHFRGVHPIIAPGDCVRCRHPVSGTLNDPLPQNTAGWAFVGFAETVGAAVVFVRRHLARGAVATAMHTRAVFRRDEAAYEDRPVWLVHVDRGKRLADPPDSDDHLYGPFIRVEDPTVDLPLLGPVRRHQLLPPQVAGNEPWRRLNRHRHNTVDLRLPKGFDRPCRPASNEPWVPKLS